MEIQKKANIGVGNTLTWNRTRNSHLEGGSYFRLTMRVGGGGTYLYPQLKGQLSG